MKFALVIVVIGTTLGVIGGRWAGGGVVGMYEQFFRFPHLGL
jgi:putative ABC transport system permease protein